MKQIKFRAWDKEANIMVYSDRRTRKLYDVYYGFEMNGEGELECRWEGEFTESQILDGGILDNIMQSTGLKDKNGVEIYEGDIIRFKFKNETRIGFVEYVRSSFLINVEEIICDNKIRHSFSNSSSEEHEIIGDIYQNKDLLEG